MFDDQEAKMGRRDRHPNKEPAIFDLIAASYVVEHDTFYAQHQSRSRALIYGVLTSLIAGKTLLDVGCGHGIDADFYHRNGAQVFGIDASEEMLKIARERHPHLTQLTRQTMERTTFKDGFFQHIACRLSLHYAQCIDTVYHEWHRLLAAGGTATFVVPHPEMQQRFLQGRKENCVAMPILNGKCSVRQPVHTIEEYLSPTLHDRFEIIQREEGSGAAHMQEHILDILFLHVRKKASECLQL